MEPCTITSGGPVPDVQTPIAVPSPEVTRAGVPAVGVDTVTSQEGGRGGLGSAGSWGARVGQAAGRHIGQSGGPPGAAIGAAATKPCRA